MLSLEAANELIWKKFRELPLEYVNFCDGITFRKVEANECDR
jgi:hypothetical protein